MDIFSIIIYCIICLDVAIMMKSLRMDLKNLLKRLNNLIKKCKQDYYIIEETRLKREAMFV